MSSDAQIIFNSLTVIAILIGPLVGIQVQLYLEKKREQERRKIKVFRELMVTRSTVLSPRHVEALNAIQMEFSAKVPGEKKVLDAWQLYINHLASKRGADQAAWAAEGPDLLADLLLEMAICLEFHDFNKARIKTEGYVPQYFLDIEQEQNELRKAALGVFQGAKPLKVQLTEGDGADKAPLYGRA